MTLEALDKLREFAGVFDLDAYRKKSYWYKCDVVLGKNSDAFKMEVFNLYKEHDVKLPSRFASELYLFIAGLKSFPKRVLRKVMGTGNYEALKKFLKR